MYYSVCLPAVLRDRHPEEALAAVAAAGFSHYEIWGWWNQDPDAYESAQKKWGFCVEAMCTRMISLTDPACRPAYLEGLRETVEVCRRLGCKTIISQVGAELPGVERKLQHESIVEGLKACLPILEEANMTLVIEPLNTRIDHKGYYLWSSKEAFEIVDQVGDGHVKVLYDLYHQYVMEDLDVAEIRANIEKIGHFHMAGYPGRHEPMTESEVDYPTILKAIRESGYQYCVGMEYLPVQKPEESLQSLWKQLLAI